MKKENESLGGVKKLLDQIQKEKYSKKKKERKKVRDMVDYNNNAINGN